VDSGSTQAYYPFSILQQTGATGAPSLRIAVTGSSGLLGRILVNLLKNDYEVIGIDKYAPTDEPDALALDITQTPGALELMVKLRPSVVVHTAAETNVDLCETDHEHARSINVEGTANIVKGCTKVGARMIFISTDYVFDGVKGNYSETDQPNPISYYGLSKLEAEHIVTSKSPDNTLIMRASVLYGWHPSKPNFATWVIKSLRENQTIRVVKDHINSPTLADNLASAIRAAIERGSEGLLHVAGSERISRFDFACRIAKSFDLDENLLVPVEMRDMSWVAKRPRDSSLDVAKAEKELGIELLGVDRGLEEMLRSQL
jgi:dTDP-4-dehydrorhamnose reductase